MEYTISENRLRKLFVNYMDSIFDLKYEDINKNFLDSHGDTFGYLQNNPKQFHFLNYKTEGTLLSLFGEMTYELLLYYLRERFPDVEIDGVE